MPRNGDSPSGQGSSTSSGPPLSVRKVEIGIRVRFAVQREVPPFLGIGDKPFRPHEALKQRPVGPLLRRDLAAVRPGNWAEKVEPGPHVEFADGAVITMVHDGDIDRTPPRVARAVDNIAFRKQILLGDIGVIVRFGPLVVEILAPTDEVIDRPLGPVGIEDFEPETERP